MCSTTQRIFLSFSTGRSPADLHESLPRRPAHWHNSACFDVRSSRPDGPEVPHFPDARARLHLPSPPALSRRAKERGGRGECRRTLCALRRRWRGSRLLAAASPLPPAVPPTSFPGMLAAPLFVLVAATLAAGSPVYPGLSAPKLVARQSAPTVSISNGTLVGRSEPGFKQEFFLNVPYAQAPTGDLVRWPSSSPLR